MSKFKVGDKVHIIGASPESGWFVRSIGGGEFPIELDNGIWHSSSELTLIEPPDRFDLFLDTLKRWEVYHPTREQLDELRLICEQDFGIPHDAAYASELFWMACDSLGADGAASRSVRVYAQYGDLVEFVRLVQSEAKANS